MTEKQYREKIVTTAQAWEGYKESDGTHKTIIDTYNAHTPLARGYKVSYTDAWCSTFASAVAIKAGLTSIIPTECGCEKHIELFKGMGSWMETDSYTPEIGDYIFYDWDDSGSGDCTGSSDHVGIVTAVNGTTITVIEGNKNNAVAYRTMTVNGKYIRGYGIPDYASLATDSAVATAVAKLESLGVINSPDYWKNAATADCVLYLDLLLTKAASVITKSGTRTDTPEEGVTALVAAGIINTPAYWLANYGTYKNLDLLLCALGGAVK